MRKMWEKFSFPFRFDVYVFNMTNPDGFMKGEKVFKKLINFAQH